MAKTDITSLPVGQLRVDRAVQRELDKRRVQKMVREWAPEGLGVLTISRRSNGDLIIVDGQHRVAAAMEAEGGSFQARVEVFEGLTLVQEAALFRVRNTTAKPSYLDSFHVRLAEQDPTALKILKLATAQGWKIADTLGNSQNYLYAVAALERVLRLDPESEITAAEKTLYVVKKAWDGATGSNDGRLLEGIGLFLARHRNRVDVDNLAERLAQQPGGPNGLLGQARTLRDMLRTKVTHAVAEIVTGLYNKHRKSSAVPLWRS